MIHFRKSISRLWPKGLLSTSLCFIDIDNRRFLRIDRMGNSSQEGSAHVLPLRSASLARKHERPIHVHQSGVAPFQSDRGAAQGDVDAPLESCLFQGGIARRSRRAINEQTTYMW